MSVKTNGAILAKKWGVNVRQARYSEWGNWYSPLTEFPGALLDKNGYIVFRSLDDMLIGGIRVTKQINIPDGISSINGYIRIITDIAEEIPWDKVETYREGRAEKILVNKYERDSGAKISCIKHHGAICAACRIDMSAIYGKEISGFIHVHHIVPIAEMKAEYCVNPITDLVPLCPNCHAVVHKFRPILSVEELRLRIAAAKNDS